MTAVELDSFENTPAGWSARSTVAATSWEACGWSYHGQHDRARRVADTLFPQPGESLLDFGCGTGVLTDYLIPGVAYIGYDPAEGMVARAKREHPGWRFQSWEPAGDVDLVAAIGPFNLPGGWSKQHTWHELRRLWDRTRRALAVSLYAGSDERCLIYSEAELERHAAGETLDWTVARWRPNDLLLVLRR